MFPRLTRIATSFAAVLAAYLAYSFAAAPFIEPSVKERERSTIISKLAAHSHAETRDRRIRRWFAPGSWELQHPTVLETEKGMLLIKDYKQLPDGSLELVPCTLILNASSDSGGKENGDTRGVLLQAPKAVLKFEGPTNLARGQFGRLQGGTLVGAVTVRSAEIQPEADDFLLLQTRDVQVTQDGIVAPHEVSFRYGRNYGSGRDLIVAMESDSGGKQQQVGRPKRLELVHVDKIHVHLDAPNELKRRGRKSEVGQPLSAIDMEVTCDGPFKYDFQRRVARFEDRVEVRAVNPGMTPPRPRRTSLPTRPDGSGEPSYEMPAHGTDVANSASAGLSDQLSCNVLRIYFFDRNKQADQRSLPDAVKPPDLSTLAVERIVAEGTPAVLRAPSYEASARGDRLEFDFRNKRVRFEDHEEVFLRYRQSEVETPAFEYRFADGGRLGQLQAAGPGAIRGALPDDPTKMFEAVWRERLILQPDDGDHALSLVSGAMVRYYGVGEISANDLHVWLREAPCPAPKGDGPRFQYRPVSMLADRNVRINSWQLSGAVQKAEVWIRYDDGVPAKVAGGTRTRRPDGMFDSSQAADRLMQKFDIAGQGIQLQLVHRGPDTDVEHLIISGNVRLREVRTKKPDNIPIDIAGEMVQLDYADTPHALARIQGAPAKVAARGLAVIGDDIQLDRGKNRLWIPGAGKMTLPPPPAGQSAAGSSPLPGSMASPITVTWTGHMDLDGLVANFERGVQVSGLQQTGDGEVRDLLVMGQDLDVTLTRRVDFAKETQPGDLDVRRLAFRGSVALQNRGSRNDQRTSYDRMEVRDLHIDAQTGNLHANGPGWGSTVRYGRSLSASEDRQPRAVADPDAAELVYLRIDFDGELVGNLLRRDMECRGRVRGIYGPVATWDQTLDPDPPDGPEKGQILLTSERLTVAEMGTRADNSQSAVELMASENATIEGKGFTARGWRIKYAKAKSLLILEGDGRNDAELWLKGSTTPNAAAQQVLFWTDTHRFQAGDARELHFLP